MNKFIWRSAYCSPHIISSTVEGWSHVRLVYLSNLHVFGILIRFIYRNLTTLWFLFLRWHEFFNLDRFSRLIFLLSLEIGIVVEAALVLLKFVSFWLLSFCKVVVEQLMACCWLNGNIVINEFWLHIIRWRLSSIFGLWERNKPLIMGWLNSLLYCMLDSVPTLVWNLLQTMTGNSIAHHKIILLAKRSFDVLYFLWFNTSNDGYVFYFLRVLSLH